MNKIEDPVPALSSTDPLFQISIYLKYSFTSAYLLSRSGRGLEGCVTMKIDVKKSMSRKSSKVMSPTRFCVGLKALTEKLTKAH